MDRTLTDTSDANDKIPTCTLETLPKDLGRNLPEKLLLHLKNWAKLKRDSGAPSLIDLFVESDPVTQPWLVVIDTERAEAQNTRLVGSGIVDFFGFDPTGYDFLQSVAPDLREVFVGAHRRLNSERIGKFHLAVCSTSTGRELEVFALALPYQRKGGLPCVAWLLVPGAGLQYGETGSQVRSVVVQRWIELPATPNTLT